MMDNKITLVGLSVGEIRLKKEYITRERLTKLFALEGTAIVIDEVEGEEIEDLTTLTEKLRYVVLAEEDLSDDSPFQNDPTTLPLEERQKLFIKRNVRLQKMQEARRELIRECYIKKNPEIYNFSFEFLHPDLQKALDSKNFNFLTQLTNSKIFTFPVFTNEFCDKFVDEIENFEKSGLPTMRPNSMNNYGIILDEIGFTEFLTNLRISVVQPFAELHFPLYGGNNLDDHHGFIVEYSMSGDHSLDFHYDDSEVTLNVCLGKSFTGGSLFFKGYLFDESTHSENVEIQHQVGHGLLHLGKHRHGANPLTSGHRYNLILWCRNTNYQIMTSAHKCCGCGHDHNNDHNHDHNHDNHHHTNRD